MARLVLLRHGESQWNLENRFTGWHDVPLTDQGVAEAVAEATDRGATTIWERWDGWTPDKGFHDAGMMVRISDFVLNCACRQLRLWQDDLEDALLWAVKQGLVDDVFHKVAGRYDLMNDLLSFGLHRAWKAYTVAVAQVRAGDRVLDIAGGTGDLALAFAREVGPTGRVVHTDINEAMLREGRARLLDHGLVLPTMVCDAEKLPFADASFDIVTVAFGLRNMTHKELALAEMHRTLKPGGKLLVLEFSRVAKPLEKAYDWYSFNILPKLGQLVAGDADSYRYLAESIRMHPDQATLKAMMEQAGLERVEVFNLTAGVVALHRGYKL